MKILCIFDFDETLVDRRGIIGDKIIGLLEMWKSKYDVEYAIASFNDKADEELKNIGIGSLFSNICCGYDKWNGSKSKMIENIIEKTGIKYGDVIFFDDLEENIKKVRDSLGIHCVQVNRETLVTNEDFEKAYEFITRNTVWIGSNNIDKIKAVRNIVETLKIPYIVRGCNIESNVCEQPIGEYETILGAGNRANNTINKMISKERKNDLAIGIENGIVKSYGYNLNGALKEQYYDKPIAVMIDNNNNVFTGQGPAIAVPYNGNMFEYGSIIKQFDYKVTEYYSCYLLNREISCESAIKTVFGNFYNLIK